MNDFFVLVFLCFCCIISVDGYQQLTLKAAHGGKLFQNDTGDKQMSHSLFRPETDGRLSLVQPLFRDEMRRLGATQVNQ